MYGPFQLRSRGALVTLFSLSDADHNGPSAVTMCFNLGLKFEAGYATRVSDWCGVRVWAP